MQTSKSFIAVSLATILAYFQPIQSVLTAILYLFLLNFLFGLVAGIVAKKENFSFRKAFTCISEVSVFLVILSTIFYIGDHLGARGGAMQAISTITYALLYFYSVNILKNLKLLFPASKGIVWFYNLLSIELIAKLPRLNKIFTTMDTMPDSNSDNRNQTIPTATPTGTATMPSSATPTAPQSSPKTYSSTTTKTASSSFPNTARPPSPTSTSTQSNK